MKRWKRLELPLVVQETRDMPEIFNLKTPVKHLFDPLEHWAKVEREWIHNSTLSKENYGPEKDEDN